KGDVLHLVILSQPEPDRCVQAHKITTRSARQVPKFSRAPVWRPDPSGHTHDLLRSAGDLQEILNTCPKLQSESCCWSKSIPTPTRSCARAATRLNPGTGP